MCDPIVEVEQGKLKGNVRKTKGDVQYYSFKSIPYAKPPVGHLRFSIPQPPEPWEGVRDATVSCNICAQFDRLTKVVVGDEDCLYLNVYTPKLPSADCAALPVMVFFHGGGFVFGNGTDDSVHGPDFLIEKDVVIVSLNYRLGILGFLSLNCKEAPGNMGLRDQVQALKWVQKNITNFGGDPTNVTIFGISAGGASVEYLVLSRMAKGLFHKAIAQSGSSLNHWAHNNNIKELAALMPVLQAKILSGTEELLQYLKDLPIKNLIMFSMAAIAANSHKGGIHFGFVPTVETPSDWEPFLDKSPYDLLANGEFTKVPYISGFCDREGLLMLGLGAAALEKVVKGKEFTQFLPFEIDQTQIPEVEKKFKLAYLEGEKKYDEPDAFAIDYFGDVDFIAGVYVAASLIAKNNSCPVYFYEFSYDGGFNYMKKKISIDRKGACHGDDGGYLVKSGLLTGDCCGVDQLVRDRMVEMWSNFAKCGEPTPQTGELIPIKWDPVAETGISCLCIYDDLTMKEDIYSNRMKLYKDLYEKYKLTK